MQDDIVPYAGKGNVTPGLIGIRMVQAYMVRQTSIYLFILSGNSLSESVAYEIPCECVYHLVASTVVKDLIIWNYF